MISKNIGNHMGWIPDLPDFRDYTTDKSDIGDILTKIGITESITNKTIPKKIDLRQYFSPIEDQGNIGSCTAHAGIGLLEYYEKKAFGNYIDASKLFLYKVTRNLLNLSGDTGAHLRSTMGAMVTVGVCPERYWPYNTDNYDKEPSALCYSLAGNYKTVQYVRLDPPGIKETDLLNKIKTYIAGSIPSIFGFTVYSSINQAHINGKIPYPSPKEHVTGGHAMVTVGYDDDVVITNSNNGISTKGAFIIRNSWGIKWGDHGYGYLPYDYIFKNLAKDWWILLKADWIYTGNFGF